MLALKSIVRLNPVGYVERPPISVPASPSAISPFLPTTNSLYIMLNLLWSALEMEGLVCSRLLTTCLHEITGSCVSAVSSFTPLTLVSTGTELAALERLRAVSRAASFAAIVARSASDCGVGFAEVSFPRLSSP
ncbi:hypothetical protein KCU61_g118, partial [Aureobasidium melanogenum]